MKNQTLKLVLPVMLWMAVIFASSCLPSNVFPKGDYWIWPKMVHVLYYGLLALLFERTIRHREGSGLLWKNIQLASILFAILYGASDEMHQLFTPGRHARFTDVLIDGFGACLFIGGSMVYRTLVPQRMHTKG